METPDRFREWVATTLENGAADFAVGANGTLIFLPSASSNFFDGRVRLDNTLQWIDREGKRQAVAIKPGNYVQARISPGWGPRRSGRSLPRKS